jgi:hypothetical protein
VESESIWKMLVCAADKGYSSDTMRSMCGADAGRLAINYQSLSVWFRASLKECSKLYPLSGEGVKIDPQEVLGRP